jgi:hypothetical protein
VLRIRITVMRIRIMIVTFDADTSFQIKAQNLENVLIFHTIVICKLMRIHVDSDQDPQTLLSRTISS